MKNRQEQHIHPTVEYIKGFKRNPKNAEASEFKVLLMYIGTYLVETPGSSLELSVLLEIETILNSFIINRNNLPKGVDEEVILDLYNYASGLVIMRKEGLIINLPKQAKEAGRAFYNAADILTIFVPLMVFNFKII